MAHLALSFFLALSLQAQPQAPRASIEGVVVREGTSEPIVRAQITVTRVAAPATPAAPAPGQAPAPGTAGAPPTGAGGPAVLPVLTDNEGKFIIRDLPPGSYRIAVARNGFSRQEYGQRSYRTPGTVLTVQAGQQLKDIVFRVIPAGTVMGRITDAVGAPLAGITVQLQRATYTPTGKRTFQNSATARTNDLGEYRLYWVTPGLYYLSASPGGSYLETLFQTAVNTAASAQRAQDTNSNVNPNAQQATLEAMFGLNRNELVEPGFAVTYYPGGTDASRAAPVDIRPGSELRGMDIALLKQQTFRVQGRILDARTGQSPQTAIVQMAAADSFGSVPPKPATSYDPTTGAFDFREVPRGDYHVVAIVQSLGGPTPGIAAAQLTTAVSTDLENLALTVRSGVVLRERVAVEDTPNLSALPGADRMRIRLVPALEAQINAGQPGAIAADGTFTLDNVSIGDYRIAMIGLPPNVYVKTARFAATDVLQEAMSVRDDNSGALDILLSAKAGQVTGTLVDKDQKPVSATQVVLVPDRFRDRRELYRLAITDVSGRFTLPGIPPGDYKVFAWEDIDPFAHNDLEILRQYDTQAVAVRIAESERVTVEVKLIPVSN